VPLREYRFFVSKLNQIIAPEAVCYNLSAVLRIFYLPILVILMTLAVNALVMFVLTDNPWSWGEADLLNLLILATVVCALSIGIYKYEIFYKNPLSIHKAMDKVITEMSNRYWNMKTVFRIG